MARKIKPFLAAGITLLLSAVVLLQTTQTTAYTKQPIDGTGEYTEDATVLGTFQEQSKLGGYEDVAAEGPLLTAALIVNFLLQLLGAIAISLTVYAGYVWLMARGNADEVKRAKDILAGSAVGLLLILASYSITSYIFRSFVNITDSF